ncbi:unnamed protein product [Thlaspi arvense]|uniref:Uncharacterized protein n=1 Tax=Thlaspi arvense TaxID=13288 RepID=A0AAU9RMB6_THLAR|nr:unnamed protein product [Thlaspi arvense]
MVSNTEKEIVIRNEILANEIQEAMNTGYCHQKDRLSACKITHHLHIGITRIRYDPSDAKVTHRAPPLPYLPLGTQIQNAVILFCQREEDLDNREDVVVVVKLSGSQLKV